MLETLGQTDAAFLGKHPDTLSGRTRRQYGVRKHASAPRRFPGSVSLDAASDSGRYVTIRHLALGESSQRILGKNVTRSSDI